VLTLSTNDEDPTGNPPELRWHLYHCKSDKEECEVEQQIADILSGNLTEPPPRSLMSHRAKAWPQRWLIRSTQWPLGCSSVAPVACFVQRLVDHVGYGREISPAAKVGRSRTEVSGPSGSQATKLLSTKEADGDPLNV
jgi:hypothetical protein